MFLALSTVIFAVFIRSWVHINCCKSWQDAVADTFVLVGMTALLVYYPLTIIPDVYWIIDSIVEFIIGVFAWLIVSLIADTYNNYRWNKKLSKKLSK